MPTAAPELLAPDEFADILDTPEFQQMPAHERAVVFDRGVQDTQAWMQGNGMDDEESSKAFTETAQALAGKYRPAQADIDLSQQGPLATAYNALKNLGPDLVAGVGGGIGRGLDTAADWVAQETGTTKGGGFGKLAQVAEDIGAAGAELRPLNPANPTAATIGKGVGQAASMLATAGASVPLMGARAMAAVPAGIGAAMGMGEGIKQAESMGINDPAARLAMGGTYAAIEAGTEAIGGIGGKLIPVTKGLTGAVKNLLIEGGEEMLSGTLQDMTTSVSGLAVADPRNPGYTLSGFKLPALDAAMLERRKQEAIGGMAGGAVFSAVNAAGDLAGRAASGQPAPPPNVPAGGTSVSPLGDIAAGTFVPDPAVVAPAQTVPAFRDNPLDTPAPVGSGNVLADYGIAKSPEAQAAFAAAELARQQQESKLRATQAKAGSRMPVIPDSPLGGRDILDFVNDNPLHIPRKGSAAAGQAENNWAETYNVPLYYRKFLGNSERGHNATDLAQMAYDEHYIQEPTADALMAKIDETIRARTTYKVEFRKREKALEQEGKQVLNFEKDQDKLASQDKTLLALDDVNPGDEMTINGETATVKKIEYDSDGYLTNVVIEDGKRFGVLSLDPTTRAGIFVDEWAPKAREVLADDPFSSTVQDARVPAAAESSGLAGVQPAGVAVQAPEVVAAEKAAAPLRAEAAAAGLDSLLQGTESTRPMNVGETAKPQAADPLAELGQAKRAGEAEQAQGKLLRQAHATDMLKPGQVKSYYESQGLAPEQAAGASRIHVESMVKGVAEFVDQLFGAKTAIGYNPVKINAGMTRVVATGRGLANERGIEVSTAQSPLNAAWVAAHEMFHRFYPTAALKVDVPEAVRKGAAGKHPATLSMEKESKAPQERMAVDFANWVMRQAHPEHAANFPEVRTEVAAFFTKEAEQAQGGFKNLNTGGNSEAGFTTLPHVDALFDMATAAVQAGKKFTVWAREMVARFGEAIRDYLSHLWMAAKEALPTTAAQNVRLGGAQGAARVGVKAAAAVINPFDKLKGGTNIFHTKGEPFRVNSLGLRQILTGSPLPGELVPVLTKTQNEKLSIEQKGAQLGADLLSSITSTVDRTGLPAVQVNDLVSAMLNGTPGADVLVSTLSPVLHERTRSVRVLLDNLSAAVAQTLPNTPLRATIVGNLGSWLRRSYAAFDPASGWNYDNLLKKAAAGEQVNGRDAADILDKARRYLRTQPGGPHPASEIEADLRDLMDRNVWEGALLGGAGARKSVSSLMQRKDIAPEIRAVMGEENNPVKRAMSSLSFQAQFIARHHGQVAMRQVGLASELFSTQRGGVHTQEIPVDGPKWSGLAGTWTTPQLWQALQNAQGVTLAGTDLGGLLVETLKAMGNEAKLNRVAMNPDSWLVNILGNFTSMVQNGDVFSGAILRRITEARGTVAAGKAKSGAVVNAAAEALLDAQRDMMARLTAAGVLGSSLTLADIEASLPRHLLQWLATDQTHDRIGGAVKGLVLGQSLGRAFGVPGRAVGGALGAAGGYAVGALKIQGWQQKAANAVMTGPDALARTTGWLTNYEAGLTAGMAPDAAADWATKRTLNTYPNYAALPGLLREGSRLGLLGSFIAFQHEVYRNFGWNARYAVEELRSGNPALVQRGAQRLAGIGAIGALAGGGLAAILALTGVAGGDDERNKLFRKWYGAPWEKDAVLSFKDFSDKGVTYFNTSYLLPQMTMMELLQAAREGATPAEGAARVMDRLYEQFVGGSVHLQPLVAAATNTNRAGRPLTYQQGVAGALERADYPLETIMEPGFAAKVEKIIYAMRGAEKNGKAYSVEQEFKRIIGLREQTKTWPEMALGAYRDLAEENANIRAQANREISLNRPGASARAVTAANEQLAALRAKVAEFEVASTKLGVPMPVLMSAKREANLSLIRDVGLQVDGKRVRSLGR